MKKYATLTLKHKGNRNNLEYEYIIHHERGIV
jgi:hypothetical protein